MVKILPATSCEQLNGVRELMRSFAAWHYKNHGEYKTLIDKYFDVGAFEAELAALPGKFAPPQGRLLVATREDVFVGCVALRDIGDGVCEMKRLFVLPKYQGQGIGVLLAETIINEARMIGYRMMRLDTGPNSVEAQGIYRRIGFNEIDPYYILDEQMKDWLSFMELAL